MAQTGTAKPLPLLVLQLSMQVFIYMLPWLTQNAVDATPLTLIVQGEVKVDLADFDVKLQENLVCTLIFKKSGF